MRAIVLAYHDMGVVGLEALLRHGFDVAAVFTHVDDPGETQWAASVAEWAASRGVPVHAPSDINHPKWVERIRTLAPDVLFSFHYRTLIGKPLLDTPASGCFNLHPSLLPAYRGRCPVNWMILRGETRTGMTLHHMTQRPDAGDIVGACPVNISADDTPGTLMGKLTQAAAELLDELLPLIRAGTAPRRAQNESDATYFGRRRPEDGRIDWRRSAEDVRNLVRAVTKPYPGAFMYSGGRKVFCWKAAVHGRAIAAPGEVVSTDPLIVACGTGSLRIELAQPDGGVCMSGEQLAREMHLVPGAAFGLSLGRGDTRRPRTSVLILGVNGFIGNALGRRLLASGRYEVHGMDIRCDNIDAMLGQEGFHFCEGDISIHRDWVHDHIRECDVVVPLVAVATPIEYMRDPLKVFELGFEHNLRIVRACARFGKRLVFPSTSEVYGMCEDDQFDEDTSNLVTGPIERQRWIYACSKQLLDRVIWAYGAQHGLPFTLFRPFNWIGPRLDSLDAARIGSSRVVTQLILALVEGQPIQLVDGGRQRRCFTDVADGVECLYRIIENDGGRCDGRIINIGNPDNELSIRALAAMLADLFEQHPLRDRFPPFAGFQEVDAEVFYGPGYQDIERRRPSIRNARRLLGWAPQRGVEDAVATTLDFFLCDVVGREAAKSIAEIETKRAVGMVAPTP